MNELIFEFEYSNATVLVNGLHDYLHRAKLQSALLERQLLQGAVINVQSLSEDRRHFLIESNFDEVESFDFAFRIL